MMRRLIAILLILTVFSCQKKDSAQKEETASPDVAEQLAEATDLSKVIIQTPPGLISVNSTIDLAFNKDMVPEHRINSIMDKNPFSFDPPLQGTTVWITPRLLRFRPETALPAGMRFHGTLIGKRLMGEQKSVNDFSFEFKVAEQEVIDLSGDFEADEGKNVRFVGILKFAQAVQLEKVKKDLILRGQRGKLQFSLKSGDSDRACIVTSEPIVRKIDGQNVQFTLPGEYTVAKKKWQKSFYLTGINVFRVLGHMDMTDPESDTPAYGFRFSDPIKKGADLSGYISIEPETDYSVRIRDKYLILEGPFVAGQTYLLKIREGFPSQFQTKLEEPYSQEFTLNNIKPEIQWLSQGSYLPAGNNYKLQFKSVNVSRIHVSVYEIYHQNIGFFLQTNPVSSNPDREYYYDESTFRDLERVGERIYQKDLGISDKRNQWIKTELDLGPVFTNKSSIYMIRLNFSQNDLTGRCTNDRSEISDESLYFEDDDYYSDPCDYGYYYRYGTVEKCLIASNIGLTVKKSKEGLHVFASHVLTSKPVSGLSLKLFNYFNRVTDEQTTDRDGQALFRKDGVYLLGEGSQGLALMRINDHPWKINSFDVAGSDGAREGIDAFIYTDRGVYRPGDTLHVSAVIRMERKPPPEKQPVLLKIKNPKQQIMKDLKTECGPLGHVYFQIPTSLSDPTGNWQAEIQIGGQKFYKPLKIETVKPNRLKIQSDLAASIGPEIQLLKATLTVKYLFGAPAAHLKTRVRLSTQSLPFQAEKYRDFSFQSSFYRYQGQTHTVFEGQTDSQGVVGIQTEIPGIQKAPSLLSARLHTTVYEKGGSFVEHQASTKIYPFTAYIGIQSPFRDRWAQIGESYNLPVLVVDHRGEPVSGHKIRISTYVNQHYWWYHYDRRDRQDFKEMESTFKLGETLLFSEDKPIQYQFKAEDYGFHFIELEDMNSGHKNVLTFNGSGWGRIPPTEMAERNTLSIAADKNTFHPGDQATLMIDTPGEGTLLFTLEQGNKILHQEWIPVNKNETTVSFPVTEDMIPDCYAVLSLIQPHNQNSNDLPMRIYGIKTLYVEDAGTHLPLSLSMPEELSPRQTFEVKVSNHSEDQASFTLAVVDDGLLDLTGFKTPSPWDYFFQKLRLAVKTFDNFDEIIGLLLPDIDKYVTIGGGLDEEAREKRLGTSKVQRFKPVVLFQKPVTVKPGRTQTISLTMPNYVGSVRAMVVGCTGHSYVSLEKTVPVKQPVMILPTVPRVARPGDRFHCPVSIFAMDSSVNLVSLQLALSDNLRAVSEKTLKIPFSKPAEKDTSFIIQVGESVGSGEIRLRAESLGQSADATVNLPLNSANPFFTEVTDTLAVKNQPLVLIPVKTGLEGTNQARLSITRIPDIQLSKNLSWLIRYPYGCIEQTVSSVFPQLFLPVLIDLSSVRKERITSNINAGIERLRRFRMNEGFSYWPADRYHQGNYSDWGSNYLGHFLLAAREAGYYVPDDLYDHWLKDARKRARNVNSKDYRFQTYRLFLLALAGEAQMGPMNLLRENHVTKLDPLSRKLLAAAYALSGQENVAAELNRNVSRIPEGQRELGGTFGSPLRDLALITYLSVKTGDLTTATRLLKETIKTFHVSRWHSTQEMAMILLAMGSINQNTDPGRVQFKLKLPGQEEKTIALQKYQYQVDLEQAWDQKVILTNLDGNPLFVTLFIEGIPLEPRIKTEHYGIEINRTFYDDEGRSILVDARKSGDPFWVIYTLTSQFVQPLENLALTSIFPSGWEIINSRLTDEPTPQWLRNMRLTSGSYMDIRDDRINWFFDLPPRGRIVVGTKVNPSFKGEYVLPPVSVEAMYSPEYYARIKGGKVTVE
jgi:uncharacterized protein YfaS (alpha-2-macroglobulin family)